jgi:hypothetical protein
MDGVEPQTAAPEKLGGVTYVFHTSLPVARSTWHDRDIFQSNVTQYSKCFKI